jgi:hemolysin III
MNTGHKIQSRQEELANTATHAIGVILILLFFPLLIKGALDRGATSMIWALGVFGFGMLMAYLASTLYHLVDHPQIKSKMRVWDHIGIFLLIGGTYTPVVCRYTDTHTAMIFLSVMWSLIVVGSVLKVFFTGRYDRLSTVIYLFLGWMVVFIIRPVRDNMPFEIFMWILAGGLAYTLGVIFYKWRSLKYQHSIWHLFVLAGTALQFVAVYKSL